MTLALLRVDGCGRAGKSLICLLLAVTLFSQTCPSMAAGKKTGVGRTRLNNYLKEFVTLKAMFDQEVLNEKGTKLESAHGVVYLQRPGRFRWDYEKPFEQTIVADGVKVWIYDKELAQVTVKQLQSAIGNTPALLLGGKVDIDKEFTVKEQGLRDGLVWLAFKPHSKQNQYADIRLGFDTAVLKQMELHDNLGQLTRITFTAEERNPAIDAKLFEFSPPPGVDVINAKDL